MFPAPGGPAGRFKAVQVDYYGAFKASPYPEIAKGLIRYFLDEKRHNEFVIGTQGRYMPVYPRLLEDPFWTSKPLFAAIREIGKEGVPMSWEGRMSASLGEVIAQSMLGKTAHSVLVDNVEPAEAVSRLQSEIVATYRRMGEPV